MLMLLCLGLCLAGNVVLAQEQEDHAVPTIIIDGGANLVLTSIKGPTKAFLNQTISVTNTVTNQGDEDSGAYQVGLYLSKDTTIDPAADRLLKYITFAGLSAGQTKKTTTKVTIPGGGLDGLYYYGGVVGNSSTASLKKVSIVRFEADLVNGTVTDHKTGLMWQQADDGEERTWSKAKTYCNGLVLGGYDDWSLPRIDQLLTIVDYSRYDPAINPAFDDCRFYSCWSGSTRVDLPDGAWAVFFGTGDVASTIKDGQYSVRCVRGGTW